MSWQANLCIGCALLHIGAAHGHGVLTMDNPAHPAVDGRNLTLTVQAFAGNDMVPMRRFEDDPWPLNYRARDGANLGIAGLRMEAAMFAGHWRIGYLYRQDWWLKSNRDTVRAYAMYKRDQLDTLDERFDLDYEIRGFSADGIRLAHTWDWRHDGRTGWTLGVAGSLLRGHVARSERARGDVVSTVGSATLNGSRVLRYSELRALPANQASGFNDFSPTQAHNVGNGTGYAVDVGVTYDTGQGARFSFMANDLAGFIKWNRLPVIEQHISNLGTPFVPGASPAVSGFNGYQALRLRLEPKWMAQAAYSYNAIDAELTLQAMAGNVFPAVSVSHAVAGDWRVGLGYESRFGAVGIHLRGNNMFLSVASDHLDADKSHALAVTAGVRFDL